MEAKFSMKGPKKSNQSSNLTSQRMVTESGFMTQLISNQISTGLPQNNHVRSSYSFIAFANRYLNSYNFESSL